MPLQWRNHLRQSLEEGAGKRCSECGPVCLVVAEFGGRCRKVMLGVWYSCDVSVAVNLCCLWVEPSRCASGLLLACLLGWLVGLLDRRYGPVCETDECSRLLQFLLAAVRVWCVTGLWPSSAVLP